jgi:hypothetical protein
MSGERFVLLGLGRPRAAWFRQVAQWATSAALPAEFVKCVSAEEVRERLASGRPFSAALLDGGLPAVDRDLVAAVRDAGCAPLVVDDGRGRRDWAALGALAVLPTELTRSELLDVLATHAPMVGGGEVLRPDGGVPLSTAWQAGVVAVTGTGGAGASTAAVALAQGLAAEGDGGPVLLADLCRRADQGMLHDARELFPGLQELVEAHRTGRVDATEVLRSTFYVAERGYYLLLGLRRPAYWSSLRPRALEATFSSLRAAFGIVVCDVDDDLEGETDAGSIDVEERNLTTRLPAQQADVVFAVGLPGLKGLYSLARLLDELLAFGVAPERVVPVVNMAPRQPRARSEMTATLAALTASGGAGIAAPVFLPGRPVEQALRDGVPLPAPLPTLLTGAYHATLRRAGARPRDNRAVETARVTPGSLGHWALQEEAGS